MIKFPSTIKLNKDTFMYVFSFLFFAISNISRMLEQIGIPRTVSYLGYLAFFAIFFLKTMKQLSLWDYIYYLIVIPIIAWGTYMYSDYIGSDSRIYVMFIVFLPSYYFFRFCEFKHMIKGLVASSYFSVAYLLVYYLFVVRNSASRYDMNYAYWIATPMCVIFYNYLRKRRLADLLWTGISLSTLVVFGSRGALGLSVAAMVYLYIFTAREGAKDKARIGWALAFAAVIMIFWNPILNFLSENIESSRNVDKLIEGEFLNTTSREDIYTACKRLIQIQPDGYGPLASRKVISAHPYPHSLFYELQLDFGKVIGIGAFVVIIAFSLINLWHCRKDNKQIVAAIVCIIGIGSLLVTSSYYYEMEVPATIAMFVTMCRRKKGELVPKEISAENT